MSKLEIAARAQQPRAETSARILPSPSVDAESGPGTKERAPSTMTMLGRNRLRLALMVAGIAAFVIAGGVWWLRSGRFVSTDDAYVHAAKLMVSTDVSGIVATVDVKEGQSVKAGQKLFSIDPTQYRIALDSARSNLKQTALSIDAMKQDYRRMLQDIDTQKAQVALDQASFDRYAALVRTDTVSKANYDQARFTLAVDKSKLESLGRQAQVQLAKIGGSADAPVSQHPLYLQAKAQVDEAQRQLDHTVVKAPFDGVVTQVSSLQPGTYLVSQTAALTNTGAVGLVSSTDLWVDANLKETDLTNVVPGQPVDITVDTYPGRTWKGSVESIAPASGAEFSILPAQNASGNWVKVVQRIPVRVRIDAMSGGLPLRAGMSVTAEIDIRHRPQPTATASLPKAPSDVSTKQ